MSELVAISEYCDVDPEGVKAFAVKIGELTLTAARPDTFVSSQPDYLVGTYNGVPCTGFIFTEGGISAIDPNYLRGFIAGGKTSRMCAPPDLNNLLKDKAFSQEADSLVFKNGGVITIPRGRAIT